MNILDKVNELLVAQREDSQVLEIFKTGSQLFRENPTDLDYVAICSNYTQRRRKHLVVEDGQHYDITIISPEAVQAQFDFNDRDFTPYRSKLFNYLFLYKEVIYGGYNVDWNMFEHEGMYKSFLRDHFDSGVGKSMTQRNFGKLFVHYYIILKMYERQEIEVTADMLTDIRILYSKDVAADPIIEWIVAELDKLI